ncbi:hypothetical protein C900_04168 [Fulvivirga imtechensis AK7]|uniref:Fibronectin type-III domain-containing protein n=1 Tax=Fulvivirga imtechensis AK7 TaxID=1237149 RepID=L8JWB0_9BACT|nr:fibronectin type III domain-containing protein [Fulvivirga imtechensis]ELR73316.1 hypothetical protein C900_04168 [Fulvivirga imtechensis AK7]
MTERHLFNYALLAVLIFMGAIIQSCKDDDPAPVPVPPELTTLAITDISFISASGGGEIISDGGEKITARGVCWSTSTNPTVEDSFTEDGTGSGSFTSLITGLEVETTYYVRAYATNSVSTAYGGEVSFTTTAPVLPAVTAIGISQIEKRSAIGGGEVSSDGGAGVTARGICWSTVPKPTVENSSTTDGTGTGSFTSYLTNLTPETVYYVRAYATNSVGTVYSEEITFTTTPYDIYLAGYTYYPEDDGQVATYWKNGVATLLPTAADSFRSYAKDLALDGGNVYVVGYASMDTHSAAVYWNNDEVIRLTDDDTYSSAHAIAISGGDVYIVGHHNYKAVYWKNGMEVPLSETLSGATDIAVVDGDIYISGYEYNEATSKTVALYWKNGTPVNLTDGTNNADASAIFINGSDVYVAGQEYFPGSVTAKYWKNGMATDLVATNPRVSSMVVADNDVHIVGIDYANTSSAAYWVNATPVALANATDIMAKDIVVLNGDVYIAGTRNDEPEVQIVWKNQEVITELTNADAQAILID